MLRRRRKTDYPPGEIFKESTRFEENDVHGALSMSIISGSLKDYFKFAFYCMLLAVPLYAITMSVIDHNWVMVIIDALIVPVGFVHGILLLFGFIN
jgi:hypothetical protein